MDSERHMALRRHRRPSLLKCVCFVTTSVTLTITVLVFVVVVRSPRTFSSTSSVSSPSPTPSELVAEHEESTPTTPVWNLDATLVDRFVDRPPDCDVGKRLLLILVTSAPHNFDRRRAIRETWAAAAPTRSRTVFLVGRPMPTTNAIVQLLDNEFARHADLLMGDYVDTYRNLTLKVLHGLLFAERSCGASAEYVLKTDDDCFVNVRLLVDFLQVRKDDPRDSSLGRHPTRSARRLYVGRVQRRSRVIRSPQSKWFVPPELFVPNTYPDYASGIGYIISADLLPPLLAAASMLPPFPNEDAYVGVLMSSRRVRVSPIHSARFVVHGFSLLRPCNYLYVMVVHRVLGVRQQQRLAAFTDEAFHKCRRLPRPDADDGQLDDQVLASWRR